MSEGVDILRVAERHAPEVVYLALKEAGEREQELTKLLLKAREQFAYIEQEAYSDNQAMKVIRACQIAFEQIDAALAPVVEEQR